MLNSKWQLFLSKKLNEVLKKEPLAFSEQLRNQLPIKPGVYVISLIEKRKEKVVYVGRTLNLQDRVYLNHLMGNLISSSLKKHICKDPLLRKISCKEVAKEYILKHCQVRYIIEHDTYKRGFLEHYFCSVLKPKYCDIKEY